MGNFSENDTEYRFFDAQEDVASVSDLGPGCSNCHNSNSGVKNWESRSFNYDVWIRSPRSVRERRGKFLRWMGLNLDNRVAGDDVDLDDEMDAFGGQIDRVIHNSEAVLRLSTSEDEFSSSKSTASSWSLDACCSTRELGLNEHFMCRLGNSNGARECNDNDLLEDANLSKRQASVVNLFQREEELRESSSVPPVAQLFVQREIQLDGPIASILEKLKNRWLRRIRSMSCITGQNIIADDSGKDACNPVIEARVQRVKVRPNRKQLKELSGLFKEQGIMAHDGAILTLKFSLDGQYLASAGEDKVVRIWQVVEDERVNETDIPDIDPSCLYFKVNNLSELAPLMAADKEQFVRSKSLTKTADSACIIFPPKIFRILEEPLHVFRGHTAEILDLSWSKNNCLLSSSIDKTVCLWQVGCDLCLKVFRHSNYVTCTQFNPMNDDYFVSGSIDGKIRIWEINSQRVIDWTDVRDIVTAVSYRPDGQGCIIGCMTGTCHFFSVADNHLELEHQICLTSKKKSRSKRIISFQFFPKDQSKVMVTCADSQVRIISGINVIRKYIGPRTAGNHASAFFTSDGKHIISTSEDSNVYMWDCSTVEDSSSCELKTIKSFECFAGDASIALPWFGLNIGYSEDGRPLCQRPTHFSSSWFSLVHKLDSIPRGSATWPEEKLPRSTSDNWASTISRSQYKFLRNSFHSSSNSNAWGMVIVTAGWDGRIRSFHNYGLPIHH